MAKKDKGKQQELQLIDQVSASANDIWLAGLAAFEKAQREGGKVFNKLVKEGEKVESRTLEAAGEQLDEIRNRAAGTWDKLENLFEARVQRALTSLGVPTGREIRSLAQRVDNLGKSVESVGKSKGRAAPAKPKPKTRAKKATAAAKAKPRAKKAAAPKTATPAQGPDDLKVIGGIGPALERKLKNYGVTSYEQIAGWSSKDVEKVESEVIRIAGRVRRDKWIAQAKAAHKEKYGAKA